MMKYKVSIIIPVYNVEAYLKQCLDSIVMQTLEEIEIVLVDDGSTDKSREIVDEYGKLYKNILVFHKENGGQGSARNLGLKYASGEYLYFMDSDDYLEKNALEMLYNEAEKKQLDVVLFAAESFTDDEELQSMIKHYVYPKTQYTNVVMDGKEAFVLPCVANEYTCCLPMRFYKRNYLIDTKIQFNEQYIHEDEDYGFLTLVGAKRVEIIEEVLFHRRLRRGSTMTGRKCKRSIEGYIYAFNQLKQYYDNCVWNYKEKKALLSYILGYLVATIVLYGNADRAERKECVAQIKQVKDILKHIDLTKSDFKMIKRMKIYIFLYCENIFILLLRIRRQIRRLVK